MKKIVIALTAVLMMSTAAMAQDGQRRERRQMDRTEMIKQRTDNTVQKYGLDEKQAKELLALNTEYADKMGPGMGMRGGRGGFGRGNGNGPRPEGGDTLQRRQRPQNAPEGGRPNFEEMRKNMEEYNAKLQKIMTPEQYKAYQEDMEKMRQQGPRGQGQRPRRNN